MSIDLARIERNAATISGACAARGIEVFGVTKGSCGMPQVARAMLRGGVAGIGESRFENIRRLRASGIDCPLMLLRSPPLSRVEEAVTTVDISLNSELAIIEELSRVAERMGRVHEVILMVDLGDLREGVWPDELLATAERVATLPGVRLAGLGTNLSCFGAIVPTEENLGALAEHAAAIERRCGLRLRHVSGGNSTSLPLLRTGHMPAAINNLRIGEAILQGGRDSLLEQPWPELEQDAFVLEAELIEVKRKPSVPIGRSGIDAFGRRPSFIDRGERLRGILNLGREDVAVEGLTPLAPGVEVLGASSDHTVVDIDDARPPPVLGDRLRFRMDYAALLAVMTSEYVEKIPMLEQPAGDASRRVTVIAGDALAPLVAENRLLERLRDIGLDGHAEGTGEQASEERIAGAVAHARTAGEPALVLGPDHRATLAALRGLARVEDAFGLLWLDARAAFQPPAQAAGGTAAGGELHEALMAPTAGGRVTPQLSPENVVLIGLREASPAESALLRGSGITVFTISDIDALGMREVMRQALRIAAAGTRGVHVSYHPAVTDIPGYDDGAGGITLRETHQAMESVTASGSLLAMDVAGLNPQLPPRAATESCNVVLSAFGKAIL